MSKVERSDEAGLGKTEAFRDNMSRVESDLRHLRRLSCGWFRDDMSRVEGIIYTDGAELISAPKLTLL
jgi:hypothetical protein